MNLNGAACTYRYLGCDDGMRGTHQRVARVVMSDERNSFNTLVQGERERERGRMSGRRLVDFLNKMGCKRHASEYLSDSGSVSSLRSPRKCCRGC